MTFNGRELQDFHSRIMTLANKYIIPCIPMEIDQTKKSFLHSRLPLQYVLAVPSYETQPNC